MKCYLTLEIVRIPKLKKKKKEEVEKKERKKRNCAFNLVWQFSLLYLVGDRSLYVKLFISPFFSINEEI